MVWIWGAVYAATRVGLYLAGTATIVLWVAARFDTLAGRMGSPALGEAAIKSLNALTGSSPDSEANP
jgi:hypothetical protein